MSRFITNDSDRTLLNTVKKISEKTKQFDFLIGYFYFSGFKEIYDSLKDKKMRILVGMKSDVKKNKIIEVLEEESDNTSKAKKKIDYLNRLKKALNTKQLDQKDTLDSFKLFINKLQDRTLEIRKTKEPNHSKMYIFIQDDQNSVGDLEKGKVIIGSSNFSYQGFSGQNEINVYLQDNADVEDAQLIFEKLWEDGDVLVDVENAEEFIKDLNENTWLGATPTPYQMYIRVLYEFFKLNSVVDSPRKIANKETYIDLDYQIDAIRKGVDIVKKHSGVIIADVVGLGKSIIASCIAHNLNNSRVLIIAPPHLEKQWEIYSEEFKLNAKIRSSGNLSALIKENEKDKKTSRKTIIVDEAHKFRNEETTTYSLLERICINNDVILLSATPFNNKPNDVLSLIKLFQLPSSPTLETTDNLVDTMNKLQSKYKKINKENKKTKDKNNEKNKKELQEIANEIKRIIDPVVIRRTRKDLQNIDKYREDLEINKIKFPDISVNIKEYHLGELDELYNETINKLVGPDISDYYTDEDDDFFDVECLDTNYYVGARYNPLLYLKENKIEKYSEKVYQGSNFKGPQKNIGNMLRLQFVRRFESSISAFLKSLKTNIERIEKYISYCEEELPIPISSNNALLDPLEYKELLENDDESEDNNDTNHSTNKKDIRIDYEDLKKCFYEHLKSDMEILKDLENKWKKVGTKDPKLETLLNYIGENRKDDPKRKIIIFTEFADTADYLFKKFNELNNSKLKAIKYSSADKGKEIIKRIKENFDASYENKMNDYDVLIATDAVSEGWSLHRAGIIYNYDIPYNPMRVVQRVGRINRITNSPFENLYVYNYFPSAKGKQIYSNESIAKTKMNMANLIFGGTDVISSGEDYSYFTEKIQNEINNEEQSWDVEYRNELRRIEMNEPDNYKKALSIPQRTKIRRKKELKDISKSLYNYSPILVFSLKGNEVLFTLSKGDRTKKVSILDNRKGIEYFKAEDNEEGTRFTDSDWDSYSDMEFANLSANEFKTSQSVSKARDMLQAFKSSNKENWNKEDKSDVQKEHIDAEKKYINDLIDIIKCSDVSENVIKSIARFNKKKNDISKLSIRDIEKIISRKDVEGIIKKKNDINEKENIIQLVESFNTEINKE